MKIYDLFLKEDNIIPSGFFDVIDNNAKIKSSYSYSTYKNHLENYYDKFFKGLTKKEISLLHKIITHGEIELINRTIDDLSDKHHKLAEQYKEIVSRVTLPISIHVWRGGPKIVGDIGTDNIKFIIGSEKVSRHFLSTSLDPLVAQSYRGKSDWLYQIIIPKGTPAIYFGEFLSGSNYEDLEVSLLANLKMKIIEIDKIKNLKLVFARVLN